MGCFFACFSACNNKKHHQLVNGTSPNDQKCEVTEVTRSTKKEDSAIPLNQITIKKEKLGELLNSSGKKKVTFDLNVKSHKELPVPVESSDNLVENNKVTFDLNVKPHEELPVESSDKLVENNEDKESERIKEAAKGNRSSVLDLTTSSNSGCNTQNNRYENCAGSEEELEDLDLEVSELDDDNEGGKAENEPQLVIEESSESLFSLSIESRKYDFDQVESEEKEVTSPMQIDKSPIVEVKPIGLNRNGKDRSGQFVESVLNPVENLAQWKTVRAKTSTPLKHEEKENINLEQEFDVLISPEPSFKFATFSSTPCLNGKKPVGEEPAVDTSLSSWLVEAENTPNSKDSSNSVSKKSNLPRSHEERHILGAVIMEELKQHSASTSPRKCRSWSRDESPKIGTVGSYWSHTGQTIDSDSSSDNSKGAMKRRTQNLQACDVNFTGIHVHCQ